MVSVRIRAADSARTTIRKLDHTTDELSQYEKTMKPYKRPPMKPHISYVPDDTGADTKQAAAYIHPASSKMVQLVLNATERDPDGRSEYCWLRLPNGDLMLGVFPCGDTYLAAEEDAQFPG